MIKKALLFAVIAIILFSISAFQSSSFKVYLKTSYTFDAFGNTSSYLAPYVVRSDGEIIKNMKLAPNKINLDEYTASNIKDTGTWKLAGNKMEVKFGSKNAEVWTNWNNAIAADKGEKLSGLYLSSASAASRIFGQMYFYTDGTVDLISSKKGVKNTVKAKYALDGFSIKLILPSGTSTEQLFAFLPKNNVKNLNSFVIGTDIYIKSSK